MMRTQKRRVRPFGGVVGWRITDRSKWQQGRVSESQSGVGRVVSSLGWSKATLAGGGGGPSRWCCPHATSRTITLGFCYYFVIVLDSLECYEYYPCYGVSMKHLSTINTSKKKKKKKHPPWTQHNEIEPEIGKRCPSINPTPLAVGLWGFGDYANCACSLWL